MDNGNNNHYIKITATILMLFMNVDNDEFAFELFGQTSSF